MEVVMHGLLKITWRNHAQNCCEEIYRPNGLNLRPMCVGLQRLLQSKGCPMLMVQMKLCGPGRGWIRSQSRSCNVYVFLLTGSVQEKNLSHNRIDGHSVLPQEIRIIKALIITARWDRQRPHHSLILVGSEVYWVMSQIDKNLITISYAHITLILTLKTLN